MTFKSASPFFTMVMSASMVLAAAITWAAVTLPVHAAPADNVEHSVYFVEKPNKPSLLTHLLSSTPISRALIFTRTKHGADRVARHLHRSGIRAEAIHGEKSQNARQRALENFRSNKTSVLVATDIAARGLDIDEISHVINYDLPNVPETYVHRIGRTARAGASGIAVSFCDQNERPHLKAIERLIRHPLTVQRADAAVGAMLSARREHAGAKPTACHTTHAASALPRHSKPATVASQARPADKPVQFRGRGRHDPAQAEGRQRFWGRRRRGQSGQAKRMR